MSIAPSLHAYLNRERVHYDVLPHPAAFRALTVAQMLKTPEKEMAKVVIVKVDTRFVMTALPASWKVDLHRLKAVFVSHSVRLATEDEITGLFPDCELGAMPPFGNLFGIPVWVDDALGRESETVFNAGNHRETVHMAYADFVRLAKPSFGALTRPVAE